MEIDARDLACLFIPNKFIGSQSHTCSLVICLDNIILFFFKHNILTLKLLDVCCKWIFNLGGKPLTL